MKLKSKLHIFLLQFLSISMFSHSIKSHYMHCWWSIWEYYFSWFNMSKKKRKKKLTLWIKMQALKKDLLQSQQSRQKSLSRILGWRSWFLRAQVSFPVILTNAPPSVRYIPVCILQNHVLPIICFALFTE